MPWVPYRGSAGGYPNLAQENPRACQPRSPGDQSSTGRLTRQGSRPVAGPVRTHRIFFAEELYRAGDLITQVYFPTGSCISLAMPIDRKTQLALGLIGNEGMLGLTIKGSL